MTVEIRRRDCSAKSLKWTPLDYSYVDVVRTPHVPIREYDREVKVTSAMIVVH